ncbi:MAG: DUF6644 family protein [Pseudomonadota bacterium]|jgi:hypothetical protein|nr:DUF6644 family protein [Pseudomonadota bacterium]
MALLSWMESTAYSEWIVAGLVGWPLMLSMHAVGLAIVVGIVLVLNLRMLGLFRPIPYVAISDLMTYAWIGIALNIFSGFSLFMAQATFYITNFPFLTKISFIILGIANVHYTQKVLRREAAMWDTSDAVPQISIVLAGTSLIFWVFAVVGGRLIAYL